MENKDIEEINESYICLLTRVELLCDEHGDYVNGQIVNSVEKDLLEVAAKYDIFADKTKDSFAREKQVLLDNVRREIDGKPLSFKIRVLSKMRKLEDDFVKENS